MARRVFVSGEVSADPRYSCPRLTHCVPHLFKRTKLLANTVLLGQHKPHALYSNIIAAFLLIMKPNGSSVQSLPTNPGFVDTTWPVAIR